MIKSDHLLRTLLNDLKYRKITRNSTFYYSTAKVYSHKNSMNTSSVKVNLCAMEKFLNHEILFHSSEIFFLQSKTSIRYSKWPFIHWSSAIFIQKKRYSSKNLHLILWHLGNEARSEYCFKKFVAQHYGLCDTATFFMRLQHFEFCCSRMKNVAVSP